jgi:protein-S-isoprenylcysteine O-methyltransferase Ste14
MTQPRKFWMRWRVRLGYPVAVVYWFLASPTPHLILFGSMVSVFGLLVRAAAAGYLRKDRELAVSGPYAVTRNPLYLGSAILAAGFVVAGHSWWAGLLVAVYFAVFYYAVMRNEEEDLHERFGREFDAYAVRVPLFVPRILGTSGETSTAGKSASGFSWRLYHRNREYRALLGTIGGMIAVWLRMWIRARLGY